jgi:D-3-phosphoglycerate dehydrogenase
VSVAGSILAKDHERVTQVNEFEIEVTPAGHMVFFTYVDRPGVIGTVGTMLGEHAINIATMDVGRKAEGGEALMCLTVDTEVPGAVLSEVAATIDAHQLRAVTLRA